MTTMAQKDIRARYVRPGFSLMEIMIAVMILGLVMAMVGPALNNAYKKSQKRTAAVTLKSFKNAIAEYQRETHQLPAKLKDLIKKPTNVTGWDGPYVGEGDLADVPQDPWSNDFKYKITQGGNHPNELY
jgi:general secretion pathway protein G